MIKGVFKRDKKGAIELSIGTIVIIVLAMAMLILGLLLVRTIFKGSTDSVNTLNDKVQNEIVGLFGDEGADVVVKLGSDQTAHIAAGSGTFGVAIGAHTLDGSSTDRSRLKYKIVLDEANGNNCVSSSKLGAATTRSLFVTPVDKLNSFDEFKGSNAFAVVQISIPKGTASCSQKVFVDVTDTKTNQDVGGNFFIMDIAQPGIFG